MSTTTTNLSLIKPATTDEVHQTVLDLATNFQRLDDNSELFYANTPTSGMWYKSKHIWNNAPVSGGYVGWVNVRDGAAAPIWLNKHVYALNDTVIPSADNGHAYKCIQAGTSTVSEPTWLLTAGSTTNDTKNTVIWTANRVNVVDTIVSPSVDNGFSYVCITAGTSGATEPTWSTSETVNTTDGTAVWKPYKVVKWQEIGQACLFKPFGLIG